MMPLPFFNQLHFYHITAGNFIMPSLLLFAEGNPDKTKKEKKAGHPIAKPPEKCPPYAERLSVFLHHFKPAYPFPYSLAGDAMTVRKIEAANQHAHCQII
jgi:hypothetical protein